MKEITYKKYMEFEKDIKKEMQLKTFEKELNIVAIEPNTNFNNICDVLEIIKKHFDGFNIDVELIRFKIILLTLNK